MTAVGAATPRWFLSSRPAPDAPIRMFCLPPAGGGASAFRHWAAAFGDQVDVRAVALPGREARIAERAEIDIAAIAHALCAQADRPYAIFGHSMGGRIGFEVVRELRRTGGPLPLALFLAASRAPDQIESHLGGISQRSDEEILQRLVALGGIPADVVAEPELLELLLPMFRADFGWLDAYRFVAQEPLPVPVIGFAGADDIAVSAAEMVGWTRHTSAGVSVETLPGGHFFPAERLPELAGGMLARIPALLAAARSRREAPWQEAAPPRVAGPGRVTLPEPDEVHVYYAELDALTELSQAEAGLLLRRILARYAVRLDPSLELDLGRNLDASLDPAGRPRRASGGLRVADDVRVELDRCGDAVLVAIARSADVRVALERPGAEPTNLLTDHAPGMAVRHLPLPAAIGAVALRRPSWRLRFATVGTGDLG